MSVKDLEKISPNIGWSNLFDKMGVKTDSVNVSQPKYYQALSTLLASKPIEVWKEKVKFIISPTALLT
jgi:putative endopeptidase